MDPSSLAALIVAPFVGSFVGVLIERLPEGRPVLLGRSECDACGVRLGARDLVPLLSWLFGRGRCRHCGARLGPFYPAVELAALGVALWAASVTNGAVLWIGCGLGWTLLALAWLDHRHLWLPDALTLPLIAAGLAATAWLDASALGLHALGAALGWLAFAGIAAAYRHLRGREGLGGGDAKLLAAAGAWLGPAALPGVVLLACLLALLGVAWQRQRGPLDGAAPFAFGVPLALAFWIAWLHGPPLLRM